MNRIVFALQRPYTVMVAVLSVLIGAALSVVVELFPRQ